MDLDYWVSTIFLWGTAFVLLGAGIWVIVRHWSQVRHMMDTPTSKIRSAAQGYVELYGVLENTPDISVTAPLTGQPCVWWRFSIEEMTRERPSVIGFKTSVTSFKGRWHTVESLESKHWLTLSDGTGSCLINPLGANVYPVERDVWFGTERYPHLSLGKTKKNWLFSSLHQERYRYTEERLHVGQPLYAIGYFFSKSGGQQTFDRTAAQAEVIREWKQNFTGLLQRFDRDGDGQLSDREWRLVRKAAELEAEDRFLQLSRAPLRHKMRKPDEPQPFILSNIGEDELSKRLYWKALWGVILFLAGALWLAWLLRVFWSAGDS